MNFRTICILICLIGAAIIPQLVAAQEPGQPEKASMERVGGILNQICDLLWLHNDDFWHEGEYKRCIATLGIITELDPFDTEAFGNRGWLLWNIEENDAAEAIFKKGIRLNPRSYTLYYDLGMHYYKLERYQDAINTLETGRSIGLPEVGIKLIAHSYERSGKLENSIEVWQELKRLTPNDPAVDYNLSRLLKKAAKEKEEATER